MKGSPAPGVVEATPSADALFDTALELAKSLRSKAKDVKTRDAWPALLGGVSFLFMLHPTTLNNESCVCLAQEMVEIFAPHTITRR